MAASVKNNLNPIFKSNLILRGKIECLTGLHIGGNEASMEIGELNGFVIRDARFRYPYIPGSSLKGKLRHLLEYLTGAVNDPIDNKIGNVSKSKEIVRIFGLGADHKDDNPDLKEIGVTRLTIRDAFPDEKTVDLWKDLDSDLQFTESKTENTIDRLTSAANPRTFERVVAGSFFDFEILYSVYQIYDKEDLSYVNEDLTNLLMVLRFLESSALGKSGSRGYGKVRFHLDEPIWVNKEDYKNNTPNYQKSLRAIRDRRYLKTLNKVANLTYNPS